MLSFLLGALACLGVARAQTGAVFAGRDGPGHGKHIVFLAADWEYRSEECLPQLARILAERFGFKCTVLFPLNGRGEIDPAVNDNVLGMEALETADLLVMLTMGLKLPDAQWLHFAKYADSAKPVVALRCSLLASNFDFHPRTRGFATRVLGATFGGHYGAHKIESQRGLVDGVNRAHPVLRGVRDVWGTTDLYLIRNLAPDAQVLLHGMGLTGLQANDPPKLDLSLMPLAWVREIPVPGGDARRVFYTSMGSGTDFFSDDLRRLVLNGCLWALRLDAEIGPMTDASLIGHYESPPFGRDLFRKGRKPVPSPQAPPLAR